MDVDQLVAFERIVREGSFSRAAWELGLAQPTISARIAALERAVGGPLFVRSGRGVVVTDLGASFLPYARRALDVLDAGVAAAREAHAGQRGRVSIGALESLSGAFLAPAIAQFHAERPAVDLLVRAGRHEQLVELLRDGVVGLAMLAWPCPDMLTTKMEVLLRMRERVLLVAAPTHPVCRRGALDAGWLGEARPLLTMGWWLTTPPAVAQLVRRAPSLIDVPMDTGRHLVLSGAAVGFFPWMQVADALDAGRLRALEPPDVPPLVRESALVRRADGPPLSPAAAALVDAVRARAAQVGIDEP